MAFRLFNFVFPDDCRICEQPLVTVSRIPVCNTCLNLPRSLELEFFCRVCRTPFLSAHSLDENDLCSICRDSHQNFDAAYSYGSYDGPLQKLIQLFKYGKVESLAGPLSHFILRSLPFGENFDAVMAMPMHWRKKWERGFNQAELLAKPVARRYGVKLSDNLQRARYTKPQAGLDEKQRQQNLKKSFVVRRPAEISGKRVLLIDDVLTTGATLRAAAAALKASGAARVTALTLARVDYRSVRQVLERQPLTTSRLSPGFDTSSAPMPASERKTRIAGTGAK